MRCSTVEPTRLASKTSFFEIITQLSGYVMQRPQKPLLRWAGSKSLLIPELLSRCKVLNINKYLEPFVGSGALFFALAPAKGMISDLNTDLINFYRILKHTPNKLYRLIGEMPPSEENYYSVRGRLASDLSALERAARFYYLNRFCFNGIYRANSRGEFNVPFGRRTGGVPEYKLFQAASKRLQGTALKNLDFEEFCLSAGKRDLVYLDPPYDYTQRRDRGEYGPGSFRQPDIKRLNDCLDRINKAGATFLLSYLAVPEIEVISEKWECVEVKVKRQVAAFADRRTTISEVLISNSKKVVGK